MIHVANGGTAAGVSDRIRCQQRPPRRSDRGAIGLEHRRREEPPHHQVRNADHAGIEHRAPARLHRVGVGNARRSIGEDDVSEAVGRVDGQPLPDHAAERQAAERKARQAAGVGDREHVVRQPTRSCSRQSGQTTRRVRGCRSAGRGSAAAGRRPARPTCRGRGRANATARSPAGRPGHPGDSRTCDCRVRGMARQWAQDRRRCRSASAAPR